MLNLPIAMLKLPVIFSLIWLMQSTNISITSPISGDVIRGQVPITGNMDVPNFASAELAFSYASHPADSWFTIQTFPQSVKDSTLATWDTTALTDGDYILHLRVILQDGSSQDVVASDIKVRNDSLPLTETPTATESASSVVNPLYTPTVQPDTPLPSFPSSTPLPINPASVTSSSIYSNFERGALMAFVFFIVFFLLLRLRKD